MRARLNRLTDTSSLELSKDNNIVATVFFDAFNREDDSSYEKSAEVEVQFKRGEILGKTFAEIEKMAIERAKAFLSGIFT